jgi:MFS family permease
MILRVITGLAQGLIYPSCLPLISKWSTRNDKAKCISSISIGSSLGIIFATAMTGPICATNYWQLNFIFVGKLR